MKQDHQQSLTDNQQQINKEHFQQKQNQLIQKNKIKLIKISKSKPLNSLRIFNFNADQAYIHYEKQKNHSNNLAKRQEKLPFQINSILREQQNHTDILKTRKNKIKYIKKLMGKYTETQPIDSYIDENNNTDIITPCSQIFPQLKAFSQMQSYQQQNTLTNPRFRVQSKFRVKDTEKHIIQSKQPSFWKQISEKQTQSDESLDKDLLVKSKKLIGLKLPQIKSVPKRKNIHQNIIKVRIDQLKIVDVQERIKTMKYTPQKLQINQNILNERNFDHKIKGLKKNSICESTKMQKLKINEKTLLQQQILIGKQSEQNHQISNHSHFTVEKATKREFMLNVSKQNTEQKQLDKNVNPQKAGQQKLLQIDNYDKKMRIGRKMKKQQDRIRAMLIKTLEKTKATQYVAQSGSAQRSNSQDNSLNKRSPSQNSKQKQQMQQKEQLILIKEQKSKTGKAKPIEMQRLKSSLKNGAKNHQYSSQIKNKKIVQMVRQSQKHRNICHQKLTEIKQQMTLLSSSQNDQRPQKQVIASSKSILLSQNNEFLSINNNNIIELYKQQ